MKHARRIISLIFAAVIFMSAFVVFAENESAQAEEPTVPYLTVPVTLENKAVLTVDGNKTPDEEKALFKEFVGKTAFPPFFALIRDFPDITIWLQEVKLTVPPVDRIEVPGTGKIKYTLSSLTYSLLGHENYLDPAGMVKQLKDVVASFVPTGDTMYDKLLSIHNYICRMNTYAGVSDGALYCYTAYGTLIDRRSVCEGYAEAFKLICDNNKIDCVLVEGSGVSSNGVEPHMWNYVRMDDGAWYAVDVTWDDRSFGPASTNYFLVGADTEINGKKFSESHVAVQGFENMTIEGFAYPNLSVTEYDPENGKIDYIYGEGTRYYYSFLNDAQKELYDAMLAQMLELPSYPDKTPAPAPTDDMVTTEPEDTSSDTTSTEETTTEETTTKEETTEEATTEETSTEETTSEETSTSDTTAEETTTDETTTEETTTEETSTEETTTEETSISDTTTEETTTEETTTEETTTAETTTEETTTEKTSTSDTTTEETSTEKITTSDTVTSPNTSEDETSEIITLPETEISTEKPTTQPDTTEKSESSDGKTINVYRAVTVVVIVCAITCLSLILGIVVIKFAGKHKE